MRPVLERTEEARTIEARTKEARALNEVSALKKRCVLKISQMFK